MIEPEPALNAASENPPTAPQQGSAEVCELRLPPADSHIRVRLEVPEDACLTIEVEARTPQGRLLGRQALVFGEQAVAEATKASPAAAPRLVPGLLQRARAVPLAAWLWWSALGFYLLVRLVALPSFPIYFFTDEAAQTVLAADLLRDHLSSYDGELLPTYFANGSQYNLSTSVYLQVLPYFMFGKSIWVTRGVAALATLLAAASVGLLLKRVFHSPNPWLAVMFLSVTPAWFLHSRTAFETSLAASFYAAFLYFYLMYRTANPRYLYAAMAMGALAFYSYSPMRMIMVVTALLFFFSDLRFHFQHWKVLLLAAGLGLLLALPFVRFLYNHPDATDWQMRLLGSYWLANISLGEKLKTFVLEYLHGLDPLYWYLPNTWELPRHIMPGYGHLLRQTLPLGLLGVALALRRVRQPAYRTLLLAVLAAPSGAALVRLGITRVLVLVIPMAVLTALATEAVIEWLHLRTQVRRAWLSLPVFLVLALVSGYMLGDALLRGPFWYNDYGLTGMQYGAQQVFGRIKDYLREHPGTRLILSPSWSNGTDVTARFFFPDPLPFELGSAEGYYDQVLPLDPETVFVMIPEEFAAIPPSRFSAVRVEETLPYPDGRDGFYFVRLKYAENVGEVIAEEEKQHRLPQTAQLIVRGELVDVTYPRLDMGSVNDLFDGKPDTLARTWAINPMVLEIRFLNPRMLHSLSLRIGGTATTIKVNIWMLGKSHPVELIKTLDQSPILRDVFFPLDQPVLAERLSITITNTNDPDNGNVHVWEISWK